MTITAAEFRRVKAINAKPISEVTEAERGVLKAYIKAHRDELKDGRHLALCVAGWRQKLGLTQAQAAARLDLPLRTLEGIEQGRGFRYPSMLMATMMLHEEERANG
jgi:DNA-binding XRE family transcriptional regulator